MKNELSSFEKDLINAINPSKFTELKWWVTDKYNQVRYFFNFKVKKYLQKKFTTPILDYLVIGPVDVLATLGVQKTPTSIMSLIFEGSSKGALRMFKSITDGYKSKNVIIPMEQLKAFFDYMKVLEDQLYDAHKNILVFPFSKVDRNDFMKILGEITENMSRKDKQILYSYLADLTEKKAKELS